MCRIRGASRALTLVRWAGPAIALTLLVPLRGPDDGRARWRRIGLKRETFDSLKRARFAVYKLGIMVLNLVPLLAIVKVLRVRGGLAVRRRAQVREP